jgi:uncharacterized protein YqgC (DUF456 family)
MDLNDTDTAVIFLTAVAIVIGIFGTFIPFVPGLVLSWGGVVFWAIFSSGAAATRWTVVGIVTVLAIAGTVMKYTIPGRRMARSGVPKLTVAAGGLLGIVGFFVVPVVGLFLGFVLGVFLAEWLRLKNPSAAWPSTWKAVKAVGLSALIEIAIGLLILTTWIAAELFF